MDKSLEMREVILFQSNLLRAFKWYKFFFGCSVATHENFCSVARGLLCNFACTSKEKFYQYNNHEKHTARIPCHYPSMTKKPL